MRSVLFVPSIVERFIERAPQAGADVICLDLEDSIPPAEKANARVLAAKAIANMPETSALIFVRVNGLTTGLLEDDLLAVVRPGLDGIILPKSDCAETIERADHYLSILERQREMEPGSVSIAPLIETAQGIVNCAAICRASGRLVGACLGAEDLATDMRIVRSRGGEEVLWPRAQLAIAALAAGLVPIDTPEPDYTDLDYLEREATLARSLGYRGKLCIHPNQVAVLNRVFSPSEEEIEEARATVKRFEQEGIAKGRAAIPVNGKMIDTPIYWRAKRLIEWAASSLPAAKE
ncbi:MAG: CoA ester lyase [Chloroflexi bacterium]|nr:CoA ester lyase [Chloroflexota bacterium]